MGHLFLKTLNTGYVVEEKTAKKVSRVLIFGKHIFYKESGENYTHFHFLKGLVSYDKKALFSSVKVLGFRVHRSIDEGYLNNVVKTNVEIKKQMEVLTQENLKASKQTDALMKRAINRTVAEHINRLTEKVWRRFGGTKEAFLREFLHVLYNDGVIWNTLSPTTKLIYISLFCPPRKRITI